MISEFAHQPAYNMVAWTFGRGSVIWRIWPAVLLHTLFAALVVFLQMEGFVTLSIPNVMLTVLGVVIGFVISYRAMSGYERYWLGRGCWSDVMKNSRTMGRLIWLHVPPRVSPKTPEEISTGQMNRSEQEMIKVMAEKRTALDLVEAFAVALKHHIRGEVGIYYEDLYDLVRPLHDHEHTEEQKIAAAMSTALPPTERAHRITSDSSLPKSRKSPPHTAESSSMALDRDPVIPPINAYGTFKPLGSSASPHSSRVSLLAARQGANNNTVMTKVDSDLIPFGSFFSGIGDLLRKSKPSEYDVLPTSEPARKSPWVSNSSQRQRGGPVHPQIGSYKHRPMIAGSGQNLPLEVLRCLSEWFSVLEDRGTVPGTSMGSMIGLIATMEDTLGTLEKILTTPLPFVYSVHISTVWIYLFFLPFQLVTSFGWYAVPGVCIASFIYLGFLAAGEEIEQPFGYDENDLDLDMFCQQIIHVDMDQLKKSRCLNAYLEPQQRAVIRHNSMTLAEVVGNEDSDTESDTEEDEDLEEDASPASFQRTQSPTNI